MEFLAKNSMRLQLKHFHQADLHTCGWCACRVVYQHYGVRNTKHLRTALKVDMPALSFLPSTIGVVPWDLLCVLRADGFLPDILPVNGLSLTTICNRLDQGHPTIALQGGAGVIPHWNVIGGHSSVYLHIMDSISAAPGWWRIPKDDSVGHFNMFLSITGYDGQSRKTTILNKMKSVPKLAKVWKMCPKIRRS